MALNIQLNPHTIIMMVGAPNCGKSYFCEKFLLPALRTTGLKTHYLASDDIRQELLGTTDTHKFAPEMLQVSKQAFGLLEARLRAYTQFPVNSEFVVVDTTALSEVFREEVRAIAKENHYKVVTISFDYKTLEDYLEFTSTDEQWLGLMQRSITRFRREVLRDLTSTKYVANYRIKTKHEFEEVCITFPHLEPYKSHFLAEDQDYVLLSDIHGCAKALNEALASVKPHEQIIVNGDYIDKGPEIPAVIETLYAWKDRIHFVNGNHENYVYKRVTGQLPRKESMAEFEANYMQTISILETNAELKAKFIALVEQGRNFYKTRFFHVCHAPCENRFLGKLDSASRKNQQTAFIPKRKEFASAEAYEKAIEERFAFLEKESDASFPKVFNGHIPVDQVLKKKNRYLIDTGCAYGGALSVVRLNKRGKVSIARVNGVGEKQEQDFLPLFKPKEKVVDLSMLEPRERGRLFHSACQKVNFISGTMSPADKNEEENCLESLHQGLEYYRQRGVKEVVLQPKYMGSRCNVYLFQDLERCYATSRNGYLIKHMDLQPVFEQALQKFGSYMKEEGVEMMLIDAELMPWRVLGKGLVDNTFDVIGTCLEKENQVLKETGFHEAFEELKNSLQEKGLVAEKVKGMKKSEVSKTFGAMDAKNFYILNQLPTDAILSAEECDEHLAIYKRQMELFGKEEAMHLKPFMVLKEVMEDGSERFYFDRKNEEVFRFLSDEPMETIRFEEEGWMQKAEAFYAKITESEEMEGCVIKPELVHTEGVVPYLKVRNENYLTLIYGFDFAKKSKYEKLLRQKRINGKLKVSEKEWKLGMELLKVPYSEISPENETYQQLVAQFIAEEKKEKELDPRL